MNPSLRKRTLLGFLTLFGCQAAGTQVINNYGPSIYAGLGYSTTNTLLIQSGWITTIIFGNIINTVALDKFGRRPLFILGFVGCVIALIGESVSVARYQKTGDHSAAVAAVFFLFLEVAVYVDLEEMANACQLLTCSGSPLRLTLPPTSTLQSYFPLPSVRKGWLYRWLASFSVLSLSSLRLRRHLQTFMGSTSSCLSPPARSWRLWCSSFSQR